MLYVEGYDPQGAEGYHRLFADSLQRFLKNWPLQAKAGELVIDSDDFAHWTIEAAGPNWRVETRYEFLRQEQMIRANMAEPMWRQVPRALHWTVNYLLTGTLYRVYRASHQYGLALSYFQMLMLLWLGASALGGWLVGALLLRLIGGPAAVGWIAGIAAALACFRLLRPLADKLFVVQINNHWPYLLEYGRGEPTCFDRCIEAGARRVVEIARANEVDEIVVVGHSGGGVTAPAVMARALELDPELGRHGPRVVLLTPGSLMPGIGLHRRRRARAPRHRADRGRAAGDVGERHRARRRAELPRLRSGRRDRHRRRHRALQSAELAGAIARHDRAGALRRQPLEPVPHALPVHHGATTCARRTNT